MRGLAGIHARRARVLEASAAARERLVARRRMIALEIELIRARRPAVRIAQQLGILAPLLFAGLAAARQRASTGRVVVAALLAELVHWAPQLIGRLRRR